MDEQPKRVPVLWIILVFVLVIGAVVLGINYLDSQQKLNSNENQLKSTAESLAAMTVKQIRTADSLSAAEENLKETAITLEETQEALIRMTEK